MLRCKISSDLQDLNELHHKYWWIPNESMIRPTEEIIKEKIHFNNYVLHYWMSLAYFILDTHFKYPVDIDDGQIYIPKKIEKSEWNFSKSLFPYNLPKNVNHYVLWNSYYDYFTNLDDVTINKIIKDYLENMLGSEFDFVWYKNPKPSIPELWHCQVFFISV